MSQQTILKPHLRNPSRAPCMCLGCKRTISKVKLLAAGGDEWVCGKHWPAVPRHMRQRLAKIRRWRRSAPYSERLMRLEARMWVQCRDRAMAEAVMGVFP